MRAISKKNKKRSNSTKKKKRSNSTKKKNKKTLTKKKLNGGGNYGENISDIVNFNIHDTLRTKNIRTNNNATSFCSNDNKIIILLQSNTIYIYYRETDELIEIDDNKKILPNEMFQITLSNDNEILAMSCYVNKSRNVIFLCSFEPPLIQTKSIDKKIIYKNCHCLKFSPDNKYLFVGLDNTAIIFNIQNFEIIKQTTINDWNFGGIKAITFSPNNKYVLMGTSYSNNRNIRELLKKWELNKDKPDDFIVDNNSKTKSVKFIVFSPNDPNLLAIAMNDNNLMVCDLKENNNNIIVLNSEINNITSLVFNTSSEFLALGVSLRASSKNKKILLFHIEQKKMVAYIDSPQYKNIESINFDLNLKMNENSDRKNHTSLISFFTSGTVHEVTIPTYIRLIMYLRSIGYEKEINIKKNNYDIINIFSSFMKSNVLNIKLVNKLTYNVPHIYLKFIQILLALNFNNNNFNLTEMLDFLFSNKKIHTLQIATLLTIYQINIIGKYSDEYFSLLFNLIFYIPFEINDHDIATNLQTIYSKIKVENDETKIILENYKLLLDSKILFYKYMQIQNNQLNYNTEKIINNWNKLKEEINKPKISEKIVNVSLILYLNDDIKLYSNDTINIQKILAQSIKSHKGTRLEAKIDKLFEQEQKNNENAKKHKKYKNGLYQQFRKVANTRTAGIVKETNNQERHFKLLQLNESIETIIKEIQNLEEKKQKINKEISLEQKNIQQYEDELLYFESLVDDKNKKTYTRNPIYFTNTEKYSYETQANNIKNKREQRSKQDSIMKQTIEQNEKLKIINKINKTKKKIETLNQTLEEIKNRMMNKIAEQRRAEQLRAEEQRRRAEEQRRRAEEQRRRAEEQRRRAEEQRTAEQKAAEEQPREQPREQQKIAENERTVSNDEALYEEISQKHKVLLQNIEILRKKDFGNNSIIESNESNDETVLKELNDIIKSFPKGDDIKNLIKKILKKIHPDKLVALSMSKKNRRKELSSLLINFVQKINNIKDR
jgi:WD40 repeat protein